MYHRGEGYDLGDKRKKRLEDTVIDMRKESMIRIVAKSCSKIRLDGFHSYCLFVLMMLIASVVEPRRIRQRHILDALHYAISVHIASRLDLHAQPMLC